MTACELRALTAQGPAVILASREDMLRLLDEREALRVTAARHRCLALAAVCILIAWALAAYATPSGAPSPDRAPAASSPAVRMDVSSLNCPGAAPAASGAFSGEG